MVGLAGTPRYIILTPPGPSRIYRGPSQPLIADVVPDVGMRLLPGVTYSR